MEPEVRRDLDQAEPVGLMPELPSDDTLPPLREGSIRPSALMEEQAARFQADIERLLTHREEFVDVACPACASRAARPAMEKMGFSYLRCRACMTMYLSPRPSPEHLAKYYATSENYRFWAEKIFPASEASRRHSIVRPRVARLLELCERFQVSTHTLVEVGPGFGTFCEEIQEQQVFDHVVAIEPTPELADACRARGVRVVQSTVEEADLSDLPPVDVVVSFEVIEHLFQPTAMLEACFRRLRPGGLLVLSCPNGDGFEVKALGALSDTVDPEHLNYFNPASLSMLVHRLGFVVEEVLTPGQLDAELVAKHLPVQTGSGVVDTFLESVLSADGSRYADSFQAFLAHFGWSSHMWLVARRPD